MKNLLERDLEDAVRLTDSFVWDALRNKRIFITGGTGFFGTWLLEVLLFANEKLELQLSIEVLTRSASNFKQKASHLANSPIVTFIEADIKDFTAQGGKKYDFVIHAATEASQTLNNSNPLEMMDTIVDGTRNVLELARVCSVSRILYVSSGAIYGRQQATVTHVAENSQQGPDILNPKNVYAESKRLAELMCSVYAAKFGIQIPVARCFAFVGPYLNLNVHFAIGNFIRDGLAGTEIEIKGDGTPLRSYLYSADLIIWLLTVLVKGQSGQAYNVGSDEAISISDLAKMVCACFGNKMGYAVRQKPDPLKEREQYIPSIDKAKIELGLNVHFGLKDSIERTINWHLSK